MGLTSIREWIAFGLTFVVLMVTVVTAWNNQANQTNTLTETVTSALQEQRQADSDSRADRAAIHEILFSLDKKLEGIVIEFRASQRVTESSRVDISAIQMDLATLRTSLDMRQDRPRSVPYGGPH